MAVWIQEPIWNPHFHPCLDHRHHVQFLLEEIKVPGRITLVLQTSKEGRPPPTPYLHTPLFPPLRGRGYGGQDGENGE